MERPKTPPAAGELESLESFLDFQRATMVQKAEGITDEQLPPFRSSRQH
jgi:hypothetical protein